MRGTFRFIVAAMIPIIVFISAIFGFVGLGSDFGPVGPPLETYKLIISYYMIASLMIGIIAFRYWPASILNSSTSLIVGSIMFSVTIEKGPVMYAVFYSTMSVIVPIICLLFGYLGSVLRGKLESHIRGRKLSKT